jgi:hypothetical protein
LEYSFATYFINKEYLSSFSTYCATWMRPDNQQKFFCFY